MDWRLEVRSVSKSFPGVQALDDVSVAVAPGEVHAVVGENGAGKSTLMKILAGALQPDAGEIWLSGRPVRFAGPQQARAAGLSIIYQELTVVPTLSVAENIFLGREPRRVPGVLATRALDRDARAVLEQLGAPLDVRLVAEQLTVAQQQLVEIGRALAARCDVLILDEPTATLTDHEIEGVFAMVNSLRRQGVSILYITHRLEEVFRLADRVTVMKDGRRVSTLPVSETSKDQLVRMMVGRELSDIYPARARHVGDVALSLRGLTARGRFRPITLDVRRGEVVGLFGLIGAGRSEVARAVFGADPWDSGELLLDGRPIRPGTPADALRMGLVLLSEDRKHDGLLLGMGIRENVTLANLFRMHRWGMLDRRAEDRAAADAIARLGIRARDAAQPTGSLSGGNQQKVLLARALLTEPRVLILDEPTRGVDVGARAEIYALIRRLAEQDVAVLLISSELPEILGLSDRILVMRAGELVGEVPGAEATEDRIMMMAAHVD